MATMTKKKSPREVLDTSLTRLKAQIAPEFSPDPASPLSENLQRFVNSGLRDLTNVFDAEIRSWSLAGIFTIDPSRL